MTTQHFDRDDEHLHNSFLALSGNTPDHVFADETTLLGKEGLAMDSVNDLKYANFKSMNAHDPSYPSRSATTVQTQKAGDTSADGTGAKSVVYVNITARYAIKNPFFSSNALDYIANVRECQITLNFDSANILHKAFHHPVIYEDETTKAALIGYTGEIGKYTDLVQTVSTKSTSDFLLYGTTLTPSPEYSHLIPLKQTITAPEFTFSEHQVGTLAQDGGTSSVLHPSIDLQAVPSHIFLQVVPTNASIDSRRTDYYAQIKNLRISVNNQTYTMVDHQDSDFYAMNTANGSKQPFYSFRTDVQTPVNSVDTPQRGVGSPLLFRSAKDLSGSLVEGARMPFKFEAKFDAYNNSSIAQSFVSRIAFITPATITLEKGLNATREIGIDMQDVMMAKASGQISPFSSTDSNGNDELIGGGIMSMLSSHRGDVQDILGMLTPALLALSSQDPRFLGLALGSEIGRMALSGGQTDGQLGGGVLGGASRNDQLRSLGLSL